MQFYLQYAGAVVATSLYILIVSDVLKGRLKQSLASWGLWGLLDAITLASLIAQEGNWLIVGFFVAGCLSVTVALAVMKQFSWSWFENLIILLVCACLSVWYLMGPRATTIAASVSVALATLPQLRDSLSRPNRNSVVMWSGFLVVHVMFFLAGKSMEIKEVLFPIVCLVLCIMLLVADARAFFTKPSLTDPM